jgi:starvation-inducible DNA-binding protein
VVNKIKHIKVNDGLSNEQQAGVVDLLKHALADQHVLYMKMRNYHWNVTGPQFQSLHALIEQQYNQIADAIDDTAERIRQYGAFAPGTLKEMLELSRLSEEPGVVPTAREMVANLVADHEAIIRQLREDTRTAGDQYEDISVEDYFTGLTQDHQKMAWLLRAHLEGENI